MVSNFDFLESKFPVLATFGRFAEQYCTSDPNSCLMKMGMIGETVVNLMFKFDDLPLPDPDNAAARIVKLNKDEFLDDDIAKILHILRKKRNRAVHDNYSSEQDCLDLLPSAYRLCEWFMEVYGDYTYEHRDFVFPLKEDGDAFPVQADLRPGQASVPEEEKELALIREAEKAASEAAPLPLASRRERAKKAASQRELPEAEARQRIDDQLRMVGWEADTVNLRYSEGARPEKGHNRAIAEWPTESKGGGEPCHADYALFVGLKMVGIIEAKAAYKDVSAVLDSQCRDYARTIRKEDFEAYRAGYWDGNKVPFVFASNGRPYNKDLETKSGIWHLDLRKPDNPPKALHGWYGPDGIMEMLSHDVGKSEKELKDTPYDLLTAPDGLNLRDYQVRAIKAAEEAVMNRARTVLLAMATGTGKTRTVLGMIYRFLKTNRFRRILFLVDRNSLGKQAQDVFCEVRLEDLMTLDQIYTIKNLDDSRIGMDRETRVQIATVQSMVNRILYPTGEEMPGASDYDLIIVDEAHRGYILDKKMTPSDMEWHSQIDYQSKYRSVIDYFDAVKIALTATPAKHTTEIFGAPVYSYTYREAVLDGWLIDFDAPHIIKTKLAIEGITLSKGTNVAKRDPKTGEILNIEKLEDDIKFDIDSFNRNVIDESFNRTALEEISKDIDPLHPEVYGKTLIFALNDGHADLIVKILKEIYTEQGVPNEAIMKITGYTGDGDKAKQEEAIRRFKNERFPSIAVTVDLLTTGIDVPSITNLVFMRRVKSRILFEQMLGRATRPCPEINKDHFQIFDAVGVYKSLEPWTNMKPVVVNPNITLPELVEDLGRTEDEVEITSLLTQMISRLQRKKRRLNKEAEDKIFVLTGNTVEQVISNVKGMSPLDAKKWITSNKNIFEIIEEGTGSRGGTVIYTDAIDTIISHNRSYGDPANAELYTESPEKYIENFKQLILEKKHEIKEIETACQNPEELTAVDLRRLLVKLEEFEIKELHLNTAYTTLTGDTVDADIITHIRHVALGRKLINSEEKAKNALRRLRKNHSFTKLESGFIDKIESYLINGKGTVINASVLNEDSRFKRDGGYKKIDKAFNWKLQAILDELNSYLYNDGESDA